MAKATKSKSKSKAKTRAKTTKAKRPATAGKAKGKKKVSPIPKGYATITPVLIVDGGAKALEFYQEALGAKVRMRMDGPGGKLMHAELKVGDSMFMVADEFPEMGARGPFSVGGTPVTLHTYVKDVDAQVQRATKAGAKVLKPAEDQFWGDRTAALQDPFGHNWNLATHVEDVSPREMNKRMAAMAQQMGGA